MKCSLRNHTWLVPVLLGLLVLVTGVDQAISQTVKKIQIEGNQTYSDGQIEKLMKTRESSWYKKRPFYRHNLEKDLVNIKAFYHKNGFFDCAVTAEEIPVEGSYSLVVKISIHEGPRTFVEKVLLQGNERLNWEHLSRGLTIRAGQPLDLSLLQTDIRNIADKYGDVGYPYARATAQVHRESTAALVTFQIEEGAPVYLGHIRYQGLREVKKNVVRRELTIGPGVLYNRQAFLDSRQRIYSTGLFTYANIHLQRTAGDSLPPDLRVVVQEKPMRWVGLSTEAGQDEEYDMTADLTVEWGHRNLLHTGRKFSLQATATFRVITEWENLKERLELTYAEPWFLGSRMPAWISLYYEPGLKSKGRSYEVQRWGGKFTVSRELGQLTKVWLALEYENVDIFGVHAQVEDVLLEASGESIRHTLSLSWERDSRDNIFEPTRGSLTRASADLVGGPLGGDDNYVKAGGSWNRYKALFRAAVLASRIKLGWAEEYAESSEVPPDVRFYAGGASTVRGFVERSLGPMDPAGNPLGGEGLLLLNLELRRSLWRSLGGDLFFDVGNVWQDPRRATWKQLNASTGLELWYSTPVGPVRLAYGVSLTEDIKLKGGRWHLAILFAF